MDDQSRSSFKKINAMRVRQSLGELLNEVYYKGDTFIVERDGKPMAALIPLSQLAELPKKSSPAKTGPDIIKGNKRQSSKRRT
jgi:antitoxin (DNA-binding transcriptional repressor) of toxin-antitoxin stability system